MSRTPSTSDSTTLFEATSFMPKAQQTLAAIPAGRTYSADLGLRPPIGVYNVALKRLVQRLGDSAEVLRQLATERWTPTSPPSIEAALRAQEALLYASMEYLEDCKSVLRSLFRSGDDFRKQPAVKRYEASVSEFRDHVGEMVNLIKHRQGRLRAFVIHGSGHLIPGFYVESAYGDAEGTIGPDKGIHNGGNTAMSFYHSIRYLAVWTFLAADALHDAVQEIVGSDLDASVTPVEVSTHKAEALRVLRGVESLPYTCYVDEIVLPEPIVRVGVDRIDLMMSSTEAQFRTLVSFQSLGTFEGDGITRSFKLPYFGEVASEFLNKRLANVRLTKLRVLQAQE